MPTILIADDAIENVRLLKNLLQDLGQVVFAQDGEGALEQVARHRPDIVLLDVMMPKLDGHETCRQLKANPATAGIPIIFITGADASSDEERGLSLGAIDYITKPFVPAVVRARVRNQLQLVSALAALRAANEGLRKFKAAVDCCAAGIVITDREARVDYVNAAFAASRGQAAEQLLGGPVALPESDQDGNDTGLPACLLAGGNWRGEVPSPSPSGDTRWEDVTCAPVYDDAGQVSHLVAIHSDVTQRRHMQDELHRQAVTDALTGVANRRRLMEVGEHEIARRRRSGKPLAVLMMDIDHFKRVNDTLGHPAGDAVIRALATRASDLVRITDTVGRLGGEEFAVVLPAAGPAEAQELAERVRSRIAAEPVPWEAGAIPFTVSIGVAAVVGDDDDDFDHLLTRADIALYAAKTGGRNRVALAPDK